MTDVISKFCQGHFIQEWAHQWIVFFQFFNPISFFYLYYLPKIFKKKKKKEVMFSITMCSLTSYFSTFTIILCGQSHMLTISLLSDSSVVGKSQLPSIGLGYVNPNTALHKALGSFCVFILPLRSHWAASIHPSLCPSLTIVHKAISLIDDWAAFSDPGGGRHAWDLIIK